jgi:hypothetical protein
MALFVHKNPETGALESTHVPDEPRLRVKDHDDSFLLYFLTERTETSTEVDVEVVIGEGDNVQAHTFTVDDSEPLDVEGLIISRVLDELGLMLDDPGDVEWTDLSVAPDGIENAFEVHVRSAYTENPPTS